VRRAGASILWVAAGLTAFVAVARLWPGVSGPGWASEPSVWLYLGATWFAGAKVWLGTLRPIAEVDVDGITVRPIHLIGSRRLAWSSILGTEQMIRGDRLIIYYEARGGMRFVAINLNLVRGRHEFERVVEERLRGEGFAEKTVERSRYLSRAKPASADA